MPLALTAFSATPAFAWVVLPLLIFLARTADMSLSTLRVVFIAQGRSRLAAATGFFESLLWLLVIGQALRHLDNPLCVIAYAGGFAAGNVAGLWIEQKLAMGMRLVRIITTDDAAELVEALRGAGHGVTRVEGEGASGPVEILFTLVRRRHLPAVTRSVRALHPRAFITVEDVRQAHQGTFLPGLGAGRVSRLGRLRRASLRQRK